ncbi:hypothetical protein K1719_017427 [Acacia pycnantha]|nr:hypothetical protein K1719_017427 [Acacia pycnantha]
MHGHGSMVESLLDYKQTLMDNEKKNLSFLRKILCTCSSSHTMLIIIGICWDIIVDNHSSPLLATSVQMRT